MSDENLQKGGYYSIYALIDFVKFINTHTYTHIHTHTHKHTHATFINTTSYNNVDGNAIM